MPDIDDERTYQFFREQFVSLRGEIKESQTREFQILISGIIGTPALAVVSKKEGFEVLALFLPIIVAAIALMFLCQRHNSLRAGTYIKERIEPLYPKLCAWETWLSCQEKRMGDYSRVPDYLSGVAFCVLFIFYYIGASAFAVNSNDYPSSAVSPALIAAYVSIGMGLCFFLYNSLRFDTYKVDCPKPCLLKKRKTLQAVSLFATTKGEEERQ